MGWGSREGPRGDAGPVSFTQAPQGMPKRGVGEGWLLHWMQVYLCMCSGRLVVLGMAA